MSIHKILFFRNWTYLNSGMLFIHYINVYIFIFVIIEGSLSHKKNLLVKFKY